MSSQHELRRDLDFAVTFLLEGRKVTLILIGVYFFPVSVVSCRGNEIGDMAVLNYLCVYYEVICVFILIEGDQKMLTHYKDQIHPRSLI